MNDNDKTFLAALTAPNAPFLDIVRAVHRAHRLLCDAARDTLVSELPQIQAAFELPDALKPDDVKRNTYPKPDVDSEWPYDNCSDEASIWLPAPVQASFLVYTEFGEGRVQACLGLEFLRLARRRTWFESLAENLDFAEETWYPGGHVLVRRMDLIDITHVQDTLEELLQNFLTQLDRARRAPAEA